VRVGTSQGVLAVVHEALHGNLESLHFLEFGYQGLLLKFRLHPPFLLNEQFVLNAFIFLLICCQFQLEFLHLQAISLPDSEATYRLQEQGGVFDFRLDEGPKLLEQLAEVLGLFLGLLEFLVKKSLAVPQEGNQFFVFRLEGLDLFDVTSFLLLEGICGSAKGGLVEHVYEGSGRAAAVRLVPRYVLGGHLLWVGCGGVVAHWRRAGLVHLTYLRGSLGIDP
jgi:hypothetical protein